MPKVQMALQLYNILSESDTNLRQPVRLESQLLQDQRMDFEVGKSMLQLLQVCCLTRFVRPHQGQSCCHDLNKLLSQCCTSVPAV